jgi:hypothetical protein
MAVFTGFSFPEDSFFFVKAILVDFEQAQSNVGAKSCVDVEFHQLCDGTSQGINAFFFFSQLQEES